MKLSILGRYAFCVVATGAIMAGCAANSAGTGGPPVTAFSKPATNQQTFSYTGAEQTFQVPTGVTSISIVADGAAGGGFANGGPLREQVKHPKKNHGRKAGLGGRTDAAISVTPGETLYVFVGGEGTSGGGGFNGGGGVPSTGGYGGGGASDVRAGGNSLVDRVLVAGGGGGYGGGRLGGGCSSCGGGTTGKNGSPKKGSARAGGGGGGTQSQGGLGGVAGYPGGHPGSAGASGAGGTGGQNDGFSTTDGHGNGGGGGGGYYGGGGGGGGGYDTYGKTQPGGGGGGGSSYVEPSATGVSLYQGWQTDTGNGQVVFSWQ